jgi:hypothetical protein
MKFYPVRRGRQAGEHVGKRAFFSRDENPTKNAIF